MLSLCSKAVAMIRIKYTIKYQLQKPTPTNKETQLRAYISYNSSKAIVGTGKKVEPRYWNKKKNEPVDRLELDVLREDLKTIKKQLENAFETIVRKNGKYPEPQELQEFCKEVLKNGGEIPKDPDTPVTYTFTTYAGKIIADIDSGARKKQDGKPYAPHTNKGYKSVFEIIKEFAVQRKMTDIPFEAVTLDFYELLRDYCFNVKKISDNYYGDVVKFLKMVMSETEALGYHNNKHYQSRRFIKPALEVDNIYLDEPKLKIIAEHDFSQKKRLDRIRDLFLIGAYSGLRFSDFNNIPAECIHEKFLEIKTKKTRHRIVIPIHTVFRRIMARYAGLTNNSLPPPISDVKFNAGIKDVIKEVGEANPGFNNMVSLERHRAGKREVVTKPLNEWVSSHTCRRSFATNMFKAGVPTIVIMAVTGHKTETAFLKYIKVTPTEKAEMMLSLWNKQMEIIEQESDNGD